MHFKGYFYLGVSTTPTTHVSVMFLLDVPSPVPGGDPIESIGGSLSFLFIGIPTDTENQTVTIRWRTARLTTPPHSPRGHHG